MPFDAVRALHTVDHPRWLKEFLRLVGKGINRYEMIGAGDRVLIAVSGGADSLAVALALALRRRFLPITYDLKALVIDFRQYPHPPNRLQALHEFFDALHVPLTVHRADINPDSYGGTFNCYTCARNRRRILFETVRSWPGIPKIATGHHLDDIVETTLMNMATRGTVATMVPNQAFFGGAVRIVRPMALIAKRHISRVVERLELPVSNIACPLKTRNIRSRFRPVVEELESIHKGARLSIVRSLENVDTDYLPPQRR